ncbi:hypothetical protein PInf_017374 [Phytophthora infestans]|nr:hypothetical protein PInf_017374 [Phytophthora infestans]
MNCLLPLPQCFLGYNFDEGFISVVGEGDAKLSIVTRAGCSRFVAHVLVTATKSSLEGAQLSFESARVSPKEITAQLEKKLGKKLQIKLVDYEETKKGYDTNPVAYIQTRILIADGRGISGTEDEVKATIAKFFPDWNPSPWQEIIAADSYHFSIRAKKHLCVAAIASISAVSAFDIIDQVEPLMQPGATTIEEKTAVKYKPQLRIEDGCHSYPAVEDDGTVSAGLKWSGYHDGGCKGSSGSYKDTNAIMYAWYFPKGKDRSHKHHDGHRHDWEFAVIWLDGSSANESVIVGVSTTIGGKFRHEVPLQPTHVWKQLTKAAREALNKANFDTGEVKTPVVVPFNDNYFQARLAASYPFGREV